MQEHEFESVFWALYPRLLQYARFQLDDAGADDVVAEVFLTLWRKDLPAPTTTAAERGLWALAFQVLHGHLSNEYRSLRRRRALRRRLRLQQPVVGSAAMADSVAVEDQSAIEYWLGQLSPADREVVLLFNAGFRTDEIALILGCSPASAAKRRTRAAARLRTIVTQDRRQP